MIASLEETQRPDVPPWEPLGRFRDGQGQFLGPIIAERARSSAQGMRPLEGTARSGLTRRGVVYAYVREHPGSHVRAMAKELGLATGDLHYHLFWLERHGYVKTRKSGFYRFVFPTMVFKEEEEAVLSVLSLKTPREILLHLLSDASITQRELAKSLGYSQPTVSWHMGRLIQLGMVNRMRTRGEVVYEVVPDCDNVLSFVKSYHPGVWKRWARKFADREESQGGARLMPHAVVELVEKR